MRWADEGHWELELSAKMARTTVLEYKYVYKRGAIRLEETGSRLWKPKQTPTDHRIMFLDDWRDAGSLDRVYATKLFHAARNSKHPAPPKRRTKPKGNHEITLFMSHLPKGLQPCILGPLDALGEWSYQKALPLEPIAENTWHIALDLPMDHNVEYKYGLYDPSLKSAVKLEDGAQNRTLGSHRNGADLVRVSDEVFHRNEEMKPRFAGVAIPVFSLKSHEGFGVGEFADLKTMGDWASAAGLKVMQILPVNDTTSTRTWTDSYPYSAISVTALHPIYLRLDALTRPLPDKNKYYKRRKQLNSAVQLDYEAVMAEKWQLTAAIFAKHQNAILKDQSFIAYLHSEREWVLDYAVFCVKRDEFGTADYTQWGEWKDYQREKVLSLGKDPRVLYYVWLQFELHRQLTEAVRHLREINVALKGDLPIGVDRESVDVWVSPHLYNLSFQAGAPPDAFAVKGQNWEFPTYNWEEMKRDGYQWWKSRFENLSRYFDAYRIDHILGFFRIWQIPRGQIEGILGYFSPAIPLHLNEFAHHHINFDFERFCRPYITKNIVADLFGDLAISIQNAFLTENPDGTFSMQEDFATQQQVKDHFQKLETTHWANHSWIRQGLYDLIANVLLIQNAGSNGTEFHPRMSMPDTRSFQHLDEHHKGVLHHLYTDYFYHRQDELWKAKALEKLPVIAGSSEMLLCGEDLGMVPPCVPGVMAQLGILSLEIQRWPKSDHSEFFHPAHAPYLSVVSTGTHDMATLREWWQEDENTRRRFAWQLFHKSFPKPELNPEMARRIIEQHLFSPAVLAIFPLQDLLAMDAQLRAENPEKERINIPSITPFYWQWRMEMNVEDLQTATTFTKELESLVKSSGRTPET